MLSAQELRAFRKSLPHPFRRQAEFGRIVGRSEYSVSAYENGRAIPVETEQVVTALAFARQHILAERFDELLLALERNGAEAAKANRPPPFTRTVHQPLDATSADTEEAEAAAAEA